MRGRPVFFVYFLSLAVALMLVLNGVSARAGTTTSSLVFQIPSSGSTALFIAPSSTFAAQKNGYNGVSIQISGSGGGTTLDFVAAHGQPLQTGTYSKAGDYGDYGAQWDPPGPLMEVNGEVPYMNYTGTFVVKEIVYGAGGGIDSFWATFSFFTSRFAVQGEIKYNAHSGLEIFAPAVLSGPAAKALTVSVFSNDSDRSPVTLAATNLPAGASFQDNGDGTGVLNWTPRPGNSAVYPITFTATDGNGKGASTTTRFIVGGESSITLYGAPGNSIGGFMGEEIYYDFTEADGSFSASRGSNNQVQVGFAGNAFNGRRYTLTFGALGGQLLTTGTYGGTMQPFYRDPSHPVFDFSTGYNSNNLSGRFNVIEIVYDATGKVASFLANFRFDDFDSQSEITGEIRYNAPATRIFAPPGEAVHPEDSLDFPVYAASANGDPVHLTAINLPPGATFTDNGDDSGTLHWQPGLGKIGAYVTTFSATDAMGNADSAYTKIVDYGVSSISQVMYSGTNPPQGFCVPDDPDTMFAYQDDAHSVALDWNLWNMNLGWDFAISTGTAPLAPGTFSGAVPDPATGDIPLLIIEGFRAAWTNFGVSGGFTIRQLSFDSSGSILSFWASYDETGTASPGSVHGEVKYNVDGPDTAPIFIPTAGWPSMAGLYEDAVTPPSADAPSQTGFIRFMVNSTGAFQGSLRLGPQSFPFRGAFSDTGQAAVALGTGTTLFMQANYDSDSGRVACQVAGREPLPFSAGRREPLQFGQVGTIAPGIYSFPIRVRGKLGQPYFVGIGVLSLQADYSMILAVTMADGSVATASAYRNENGAWPVSFSLAGGQGTLAGEFQAPDLSDTGFFGWLFWYPPAASQQAEFRPAFYDFEAAKIGDAPLAAAGAGRIEFDWASSRQRLAERFLFKASGQAHFYPSVSRSGIVLRVNPRTGVISGSLTLPGNKRRTPFSGAMTSSSSGVGFFSSPGSGPGTFTLSMP